MRTRYEMPAFTFCEGEYEEIPGNGIEVKAWSEDCLAECVAVTRGDDAYL